MFVLHVPRLLTQDQRYRSRFIEIQTQNFCCFIEFLVKLCFSRVCNFIQQHAFSFCSQTEKSENVEV